MLNELGSGIPGAPLSANEYGLSCLLPPAMCRDQSNVFAPIYVGDFSMSEPMALPRENFQIRRVIIEFIAVSMMDIVDGKSFREVALSIDKSVGNISMT